jgi:hypothetical protein
LEAAGVKRNGSIYQSLAALVPVEKLLEEAEKALDDPARTLKSTDIPEILGAAVGAGAGAAAGAGIVAAGAAAGTSGAAALTSGLATAGGLVGGGMAAGIAVVAAPAVVLAVGGYYVLHRRNKRRLEERKDLLLKEAIRKHDALIRELSAQNKMNAERLDYLKRLVAQLQGVIENLRMDEQPA